MNLNPEGKPPSITDPSGCGFTPPFPLYPCPFPESPARIEYANPLVELLKSLPAGSKITIEIGGKTE